MEKLANIAWPLALDTAIKGALILGCIELLLLCWRRASAATRHALRFAGIVAVLCLPFGSLARSGMKTIWPVRIERVSDNELELRFELAPSERKLASANSNSGEIPISQKNVALVRKTFRIAPNWNRLASMVWSVGAATAGLPMLAGFMQRRRMIKRAKPVDEHWREVLSKALYARDRLSKNVRLLQSAHVTAPVTWGTLRPVVLLPASAETWDSERKTVVLLHELAHVQRGDYFTQSIAQIACALFWFNPLVWLSAAAMRLDREQAADDLVLESGCKASAYATHLVDIAAGMRAMWTAGAIAMARPSRLEQRLVALCDGSRARRAPGIFGRIALVSLMAAVTLVLAAQSPREARENNALRQKHLAQLKEFAAQKEQQAESLAAKANEKMIPEFRAVFTAAKKGEWQSVTNLYADIKRRHRQYVESGDLPHTSYWSTVLEVCLAYYDVSWGEPDHVQLAVDGFMKSIPAGSIYFGGTDPGRGLPTAFSKNHAKADPFFTLTQNALADGSYLEYLRAMYGDKIYVATGEDSAAVFNDYITDATSRLDAGKLKPGENVVKQADGRITVSGQVAVMDINARLAKIIFDKNPTRDFYIEESFPLEWMYPYLSPVGQVMKLNRRPLDTLAEDVVKSDAEFWDGRIAKLMGARVSTEGSVEDFAREIEAIYVTRTKKVDPRYLENDWAQRAFSKWRSGIGGIYYWRASHASAEGERERMGRATEAACRQAYALFPASPEGTYRYVNFLTDHKRYSDAKRIVETSLKVAPDSAVFAGLLPQLEKAAK
jgi:beta-lactamase regulating signal transducer with metallopeptidase domain